MKKILYFSAAWCGPCKTLGPIMESLSGQINYEKVDVDNFFKTRTSEFDELCDKAGLDSTRLWRKIQRLKGVQVGFLNPNKNEKNILSMFHQFKERRKNYVQSHWRHNVG